MLLSGDYLRFAQGPISHHFGVGMGAVPWHVHEGLDAWFGDGISAVVCLMCYTYLLHIAMVRWLGVPSFAGVTFSPGC